MAALFQSTPGIEAGRALERALRGTRGTPWQLGFLSNVGGTCPVLSQELQRVEEGLMQPDGTAGQWVVEFFRPLPAAAEIGTEHRVPSYRVRSAIITTRGATTLPDTTYERHGTLLPLGRDCAGTLETARRRALDKLRAPFDVASVSSEVDDDGTCEWNFTLYRCNRIGSTFSRKIVGRAIVSSDGRDVLVW